MRCSDSRSAGVHSCMGAHQKVEETCHACTRSYRPDRDFTARRKLPALIRERRCMHWRSLVDQRPQCGAVQRANLVQHSLVVSCAKTPLKTMCNPHHRRDRSGTDSKLGVVTRMTQRRLPTQPQKRLPQRLAQTDLTSSPSGSPLPRSSRHRVGTEWCVPSSMTG
jgi:hypothetical protein